MGEPKDITEIKLSEIRYSICTFVTRHSQYNDMVESFVSHGFSYDDCEYLYIDNSETNHYEAYAGINKFLALSKGLYIIICHQDLLLLQDDRKKLDTVIEELNQLDPNWGVCGNGGGIHPGRLALRVTDPHGDDQFTERLPIKVRGLDENFLVARRDANLSVSRDLHGFHLYGADLCIVAHFLGYTTYVVDFHLRHLSHGVKGPTFDPVRSALITKYDRSLRPQMVTTPSTTVFLGNRAFLSSVLNSFVVLGIARRLGRLAARLRPRGDSVTRPYHAKFPLAAGVPLGHRLLDGACHGFAFALVRGKGSTLFLRGEEGSH